MNSEKILRHIIRKKIHTSLHEQYVHEQALRKAIRQVLNEGDVVLICDVGAYGIVLSSNYNLRTIPQEVLIKGSKIKTIKIRQSLKALNS
mgnify:CR=1 FL=1